MPDLDAVDLGDPLLGPWLKGFPTAAAPVRRSQTSRQGWNILAGHLPLPIAVLKAGALAHNLAWMQAFARERGLDLAPHGKTTMSPQLFRRQLDAGAWGITFATVFQLRLGVQAGVRRALIANQVQTAPDLAGLARLLARTAACAYRLSRRFDRPAAADRSLVRSTAAGAGVRRAAGTGRGRRAHRHPPRSDDALALARALRRSPAVRLVGVECYEGLGVTGDSAADTAMADALMARVNALAPCATAKRCSKPTR
jgi:D-serine dehydratase